MVNIILGFILFILGGSCYYGIEMLWRGYSHYTMFIVGGVCFLLCGMVNEIFKLRLGVQVLACTILITVIEYISGYILNIRLGLAIWDYSNLPLNINGQVCLLFSVLWAVLAVVAIRLDDWVRDKYWKLVRKIKK